MEESSKLPPGREPLRSDWFVEQLGRSQQKVMGLTVRNMALKKQLETAKHRAEVLEELAMDVGIDLQKNILRSAILKRINAVMGSLDGDD